MTGSEALAAGARSRGRKRGVPFPVGVAYYPADAEADSWSEWYANEPDTDFATLASAHMTLVRIFLSWRVLEPQVGQYSEEALERLDRLLATARTHSLQVIVTLFADDSVSDLVRVAWGGKRDPRTDAYMIQRQSALAQHVVSRYRKEPAVFAWDLANEAFAAGFGDSSQLEHWARTIREAIREIDAERPIMLSVDPETLYRVRGVDARQAVDACYLAASHVTTSYRSYAAEGPITSGPATYLDSFLLRVASRGLPVIVDDIGVHSLDYSLAEEAAYVRTALYSALMNRGAGVVLRRYRDLRTERREPYFRDPFEVLVGLADGDGILKPSFGEVRSFADVASSIDLRRFSLSAERVAVMFPSERYDALPSLSGLYGPRACLHSYMCAKEAHIPVDLVREGDRYWDADVLILPSVSRLESGTWERFQTFAQDGGTVYLSYGGGDLDPAMRELFGVEFLGDQGERRELSCRVAQTGLLGDLSPFDAPMDCAHYALLGHGAATVVATDEKGTPLLTVNRVGQGRAVLCAVPVERALAQGDPWAPPEPVRHMVRAVYGALAASAGCGAPVQCAAPCVEVALFGGAEEDVVLLLNHSPEEVTADLVFSRSVAAVEDVRGGSPTEVGGPAFGVPLPANGVLALRVSYE